MSETGSERSKLLENVKQWATGTDNVRALVQTGSLVRDDGLADEFSDLDIEILAREPNRLAASDSWIRAIGKTITILHLEAEGNQEWPTRLVIFEGGIKIDFTLAGLSRLTGMVSGKELDALYERGYRVILDKDKLTQPLPAPSFAFPERPLPSEKHFCRRVEEFWFEAFHVPRYLARNELFLVKQRDWTMKELLLEMIEWHAIARSDRPIDVWHLGKGIRSWAGDEVWERLCQTFGRFDAEDAYRAYEATTMLYGQLARELARMKGWSYPIQVENLIRTGHQ